MARLTILLALLAALLFAAHASARRPQQESSCERQLDEVNLQHCEDYIAQKIREEEGEDERRVLRRRVGTKSHNRDISYEDLLKCCDQLSKFAWSPRCLCEALQQVYENQREELQGMEQILEGQLRYLPSSCGLRHPYDCDIAS